MAVRIERDGAVAVVTMSRPEALNAFNTEQLEALRDAVAEVAADKTVRCAILTGEGRAFAAGADIKEMAAKSAQEGLAFGQLGHGIGLAINAAPQPWIAAINGHALGGGCEIALACDLIVASTAAEFGLPEVKRSLVAAGGGLFRLPQALPTKIAMELVLTGDPIKAERAYALGMVNELVEAGQAVDAAVALAERICVNAPLAVRESRGVVLKALGVEEEKALWDASNAAFAKVAQSEDFGEGPRAFIEKRAPQWKGR